MSYLALARKWRPRSFAELVGQEHVVKALRHALDSGKVHHALLFSGTRGVGKTTIARIFAKSLNCESGVSSEPCGQCPVCQEVDGGRFVDLVEIDAASHTGVDDVRDLIESAQYAPARGRYKVFLVDEVHMLSKSAFNALLKTLEEPPEHVRFLLATTDPQKLPVTVLSRCLQFNLRRLREDEMVGKMAQILADEGVDADSGGLALLARAADGSLRDALSLLDQAIAHGGGSLRKDEVRAMLGTLDQDAVLRLLEALAAGDGKALFAAVESVAGYVVDYGNVLDALAEALHRIQLEQLLPGAVTLDAGLDPDRMAALATTMAAEDVQLYYQIATQATRELALAPTPRIGLEMSLLRMLAFRPAETAGAPSRPAQPPAARAHPASPGTGAAPAGGSTARARKQPAKPPGSEPGPGQSAPGGVDATLPATSAPAGAKAAPVRVPAVQLADPIALPTDTPGWIAALDRMGLRAGARQLADNCTVVGSSEGTLELGLPAVHELMLNEGSRRQIEQALAAAVGSPVRLSIGMLGGAGASGPDTPAQRQAEARQARQAEAEQRFTSDPKVRAALAALGGEIAPGSIRPA